MIIYDKNNRFQWTLAFNEIIMRLYFPNFIQLFSSHIFQLQNKC